MLHYGMLNVMLVFILILILMLMFKLMLMLMFNIYFPTGSDIEPYTSFEIAMMAPKVNINVNVKVPN